MVVLVLGMPAFLEQGVPLRRKFDERPWRALEKAQPWGVLIGDSMLKTRIDQKTLNEVADRRWFVLAQPGGSSAIWFLMMKNIVATQSRAPQSVVIFFRDRQLTLPAHRTGGGYRRTIETYMRGEEPEVENLLRAATREQQSWSESLSMKFYPAQWRREAWQDKVQRWALDLIANSGEYDRIREHTQEIFDVRKLRQNGDDDFEGEEGGPDGLDPADWTFEASVANSFLPAILQLAREEGIHLIFYRVKRRPLSEEIMAKEEPTYPAYKQALLAYLEKGGAQMIDEADDADVTIDFYSGDDHVAPAMMKSYTRLFWSKLRSQVGPVNRAGSNR